MVTICADKTIHQWLMEEDYISISTLNDFIFCPYSIYLHNVYMETDEGLYHATPQTRGKIAHETIDTKKASNRAGDLQSLPILSEKLSVFSYPYMKLTIRSVLLTTSRLILLTSLANYSQALIAYWYSMHQTQKSRSLEMPFTVKQISFTYSLQTSVYT